uniref:RecQ-mediated genome instability protein 1 n=1 Tax=Neogobius melanostomus TaxID=47308 RepID=A0A8C6TA52_9GOBI
MKTVVRTAQSWLQCSCQVQVPFAWLQACVQWLQEEAGGAGRLTQQQINKQVYDQWLLTDLRDLDHPVLPMASLKARKLFFVIDSVLDISQPAYGQLQKWKGTDCINDEVSAVTQFTQRPWEARPTRMLLLQVTDGVQNMEAMEYQPISALSTAGVKLRLQGDIPCRLGVMLLGPTNAKLLGGEVEDLVDRNHQGKVLCRALGLPEEEQQPQPEEEDPLQSAMSTSSVRNSPLPIPRSSRAGRSEPEEPDISDRLRPDPLTQDQSMTEQDFPDEDFDDLPLDELDSVILQNPSVNPPPNPDTATAPSDFPDEDMDFLEGLDDTGAKQLPDPSAANPGSLVTLASPPFTYICLLDDVARTGQREILVKAFIVTLLGKLSSSNGFWQVSATVSDGTGYLDVELSDGVLKGLLGFSVAEKAALKRDPARKGELEAGMRRCQEGLVDMCCLMSISVDAGAGKAVVTKAEPVKERDLQALEARVKAAQ